MHISNLMLVDPADGKPTKNLQGKEIKDGKNRKNLLKKLIKLYRWQLQD